MPFLVSKKGTLSKPAPVAAAKHKQDIPTKTRVSPDKYPKLLEQIKSGKNRPGTRAKLMHHIHTLYGQKSSPEQQSAVVEKLITGAVITINDQGKVTYL